MKSFALWATLTTAVAGHYFFPNTIVDGATSADWEYIRDTENDPNAYGLEDPMDSNMACFEKASRASSDVQSVSAGTQVGFKSSNSMGHPGPQLFYMARVPDGVDVDSWKPSGDVWFKIDEKGNTPGVSPQFETEMTSIETTVPASLADGNYLLRAEHIALHITGAPQFYIACAQLSVSGGGSGNPSSLVSFPGAYSMSDPGLNFNIYGDTGDYPYPGPNVWTG